MHHEYLTLVHVNGDESDEYFKMTFFSISMHKVKALRMKTPGPSNNRDRAQARIN